MPSRTARKKAPKKAARKKSTRAAKKKSTKTVGQPLPAYQASGTHDSTIPVRLSYRIIELFSDGLYSSPHKAVEELVANSFDAGAQNVRVCISSDRGDSDATIAVIDDGESMDPEGLRQHWLIGVSNKRGGGRKPRNRKQIGRFGIGKLATYVLGRFFTLVCKSKGKFYAVTIDYEDIPKAADGGIQTEKEVELGLRALTSKEAKDAVDPVLLGEGPGADAIKLFGKGARKSWTVAIISSLKPLAGDLKMGRLEWVLSTAMPLRDDFKVFLNGKGVRPSKLKVKRMKKWVLGRDIKKNLGKPAPDASELEVSVVKADPAHKFGLVHGQLGRITGYLEVYEDTISAGKSEEMGRSNGFFVYVRERLINLDDALFGVAPLHHGTWSRFRMVLHADRLDEGLRSNREQLRDSQELKLARDILHACFNLARTWLEQEEAEDDGSSAVRRLGKGPASLTRLPLTRFLTRAVSDGRAPFFSEIPAGLSKKKQKEFNAQLEERAGSSDGLVHEIRYEVLGASQPMARFRASESALVLNLSHPFVEAYGDDLSDRGVLALIAWGEVLSEAFLWEAGVGPDDVQSFLSMRDELFRFLTPWTPKTPAHVARDLLDAATEQAALEHEVVNAFKVMGFSANHIGGKGNPDGVAEAELGAGQGAGTRKYRLSLEAKSTKEAGKAVAAKTVGVSTVAQHRRDHECDHALVVAPDFQGQKVAKKRHAKATKKATKAKSSNIMKQLRDDKKKSGKTITLIRISDLAALTKLVALRGVGLDRVRQLFETCLGADESAAWVAGLGKEKRSAPPLREVLDIVWSLGKEIASEPVNVSAVQLDLKRNHQRELTRIELRALFNALQNLTDMVQLRRDTVELSSRPDIIVRDANKALKAAYEPGDRKGAVSRS